MPAHARPRRRNFDVSAQGEGRAIIRDRAPIAMGALGEEFDALRGHTLPAMELSLLP